MFTGIVEEVGRIVHISPCRLTIAANKITRQAALGDSISVNGICLTVAGFDQNTFTVDVMGETLTRTALKYLKTGESVNLESALTLRKPLGGHLVQGHVDDVGQIESLDRRTEATVMRLVAPPRVMRYIVEKGFIAVDGISLTVVACDTRGFSVSIVNYTWDYTRLNSLAAGDFVNLEVDVIAKYAEKLIAKGKEPLNMEFLSEHGFTT
ncbi:MAG: riboflavin synthase [Dehalococcoidia bacterium]|nr:riboflavin synthase [Dehalococcoidia bacterium]